jgi:hypothetical protein
MSDISAIASTMMAMSQSQTQDQISVSILKMNAQAEAAMADMLMQNARQVQALSSSSENLIDLFV